MQDAEQFEGRFLGVLGGMGPLAGVFFMERLIALSKADCNQQHMPAILWSDPRIPARTQAYLKQGPDPLPWMMNGVNRLVSMGADAIVIPCNTAHLWYESLAAETSVPILHIVRAVADDMRREGMHRGCVGLMGTAATLELGLYQQVLEADGYQCLVPQDGEMMAYCKKAIALVVANRIVEAFEPAAACVESLRQQGADAVVLGCTELPLAIPHARRAELGIPIIDSIDALARAAVDWYWQGGR